MKKCFKRKAFIHSTLVSISGGGNSTKAQYTQRMDSAEISNENTVNELFSNYLSPLCIGHHVNQSNIVQRDFSIRFKILSAISCSIVCKVTLHGKF